MKKIEASFHAELTDFRRASYYGLFLRHRRALQILFLVLGAALLYYIGARINLGTPNPLVFFLAAAYLVWGLLLFAGAEKEIRRYIKSPDSRKRRSGSPSISTACTAALSWPPCF